MPADYLAALILGIGFQYFAVAPMRGLRVRDGLAAAAKADVASLTSFEVGLFGWMALMSLVLFPAPHHLRPDSAVYWLLMQVGMVIGFATAWPVNVWLIRRGIKEAM
jgi:ABC-type antimicrobial peptide transport system permease subunit